jgi:hypothetical protein
MKQSYYAANIEPTNALFAIPKAKSKPENFGGSTGMPVARPSLIFELVILLFALAIVYITLYEKNTFFLKHYKYNIH